MSDEMQALKRNKTWVLVEPPPNVTILQNRWVFKLKAGENRAYNKHKARIVVKGYLQKPGLDYGEIFSPVARYDSIRSLLAIATQYNMHLKQFDVKTAFLHGELKETVYMHQPEGFQDGNNQVCKLIKSLYALKQFAKCWNEKFVKCLKRFNLRATDADPCVFVSEGPEEKVILIIYFTVLYFQNV